MNRDMNFFSQFQGRKNGEKVYDKYLYIGIGVSVALCVILSIINYVQILFIENKIDYYQKELNSTEFIEKRKESEEVNKKIGALSSYDSDISNVLKAVDSRAIISSSLINDIKSTISVTITNISISSSDIIIDGYADTRDDIAAFQYNLEQLKYINGTYVSFINEVTADSKYTFNIKCTLKDVE